MRNNVSVLSSSLSKNASQILKLSNRSLTLPSPLDQRMNKQTNKERMTELNSTQSTTKAHTFTIIFRYSYNPDSSVYGRKIAPQIAKERFVCSNQKFKEHQQNSDNNANGGRKEPKLEAESECFLK